MHDFASFNHQIISANDIKINAISSAGLYGKGVFTSIAIYSSKPFLWEKHWHRLNDHAKKINVDITAFKREQVENSLRQIIDRNKISNARCRLTFFDESSSNIWQGSLKNRTSLLIQTADLREIKQNISLTISSFPVNSGSPIAGVKSCNYLENTLALDDARSKGFDEAVRLNEKGEITSACMANIFWIKNDEVFTPGLETGCLAGTTREFILENHKIIEVKESLESLPEADAVFLTSAGIGICLSDFNSKSAGNNLIIKNLRKSIIKQQTM